MPSNNKDVMKYKKPSVTVDMVIFTIRQEKLNVLLIKRNLAPFLGQWALPGGFVRINESLDSAAERELLEETGVKGVYLEQLYTFGDIKRDPRGRVITVAYFTLINSDNILLKASTDASSAAWFSVASLPKLAFDHKKIIEYGLKRLVWKLEYTTLGFQILKEKFTLSQLQKVYEIVLRRKLDKRNFRKKIFSLKIIENTGEKTREESYKPAELYKLKLPIGEHIEIL